MNKTKISKLCFCTSLFLLISFIFCGSVNAFSGETAYWWNSMWIQYNVSGATAGERDYRNDYVNYNGALGSGYLTVEGTAYNLSDDPFNVGKHMNLEVIVRVGDDEEIQRVEIPHPKVSQNDPSYKPNTAVFRVSVPIPSNATYGSFSIHLEKFTGNPASHYVSGTFTREGNIPEGTTSSGSSGTQSGSTEPYDPPSSDGMPWEVAVGGLGAVAAAAAVLVSKAKKKKTKGQDKDKKDTKEEPEDPDQTVAYILQLSTDQVTLTGTKPQTVHIKAWQIKGDGSYLEAPHASLQVQPPSSSCLSVSPLSGQGSLDLAIAVIGTTQAGTYPVNITAAAEGQSTSAAINVTVEIEARLETDIEKTTIYPDGKDGTWVYARVVAEGELPAEQLEEANRNIDFVAVGAGSEWASISEKQQTEGWTAAWVVAWNYDARGATVTPPPSIEIEAFTYIGETKLTETITIELLEMPQLKLDLDRLEFLEGGQESEIISAVVDPPGENPNWDFSYEWEESFNGVSVAISEHHNHQARFELTEQGLAVRGSKTQQDGVDLKIFARKEEIILERHLKVVISREGLYVVQDYRYRDNVYRVNADGEKIPLEIGFQLLVWNEEKKHLEGDRERIINLAFQPEPREEIHDKALLTGDLHIKGLGLREQTIPVGLYEFTIDNEVPGNGELFAIPVTASVEEYSTEFNLGLQIKEIDPMADRNLELERIKLIIDRHVPDHLKEQLQNKLDQEKINPLNGAEELYLLRHDIWEKARDAWYVEAANYKQDANFNDWCVYALEWVEWAGDKAFEKAIELKIKAVSGNNKKLVKFAKYMGKLTRDLTIDAIKAYIYDDKNPDEWLYDLIVPVTDQIYAGIGDALWKQVMDSLKYEKLAKWIDECFERNIYNADGARKDGLELDAGIQLAFFEVLAKIMDYIISEAKKKAWKMALDYMKETEIRIEYRPHMEVRIPGVVFVWCCKRIKTFYDNYYTKKKTLIEAAKATVFKWVDEETDKYLDELEKLEAKKKEPKTGRKKETGQELIDRLKLNPEQLSEKRKNEILQLIRENKSLKGYKVDFKNMAKVHWESLTLS